MIPAGLCQCGCGGQTQISAYTSRRRGWVKGEPRAYIKGHNNVGRSYGDDYELRDTGHATPCWLWRKSLSPKGYGILIRSGHWVRAHVVYYERHVGPVPDGLEIDHLCRNRACVNPAHLEAVTHKENMVRAIVATHVPGISELRDARVAARMSQDDVASLFGVGQPAVSSWERGVRQPPAEVLAWVAARREGGA